MLEEGVVLAKKYRLTKPAGFGGMAQLWSATNESTGAEICVKVFLAGGADDESVARFRREATAAARLSHRSIVRVFDLVELTAKGELSTGPSPHALAITMELLKGETLGDLLAKKGSFGVEEALDIILPVCAGLGHAHQANIVHRDVKPDNIFLAQDPDGHVEPKLLDFGVSKMRGGELGPLTHEGVMLGTPTFMSPEQARGARDVDARSDVFSVGILVHLLLSGKNPFEARRFHETVTNILEKPAPRIDGISDALSAVIDRALSKDASRRYPDAAELGRALRAAVGRPSLVDSLPQIAASPSPADSAREGAPGSGPVKLLVKPLGGDSHITVPPASQDDDFPANDTMGTSSDDEDDAAHVDSSRDDRQALVARARRESKRGAVAVAVASESEADAEADALAERRLRAAAESRQRLLRVVGGVLGVAVVIMIAAFLRSPGGSSADGALPAPPSTSTPTATTPASATAPPRASETAPAPSASAAASASSAAMPASAAVEPAAPEAGAPAAPAALAASGATAGATTAPAAPSAPTPSPVVGGGQPQPAPQGSGGASVATKLDTAPAPATATATAPSAPPAPPAPATVTATATAVAPPAPAPPAPPAPPKDSPIVRDPGF